MDSVRTILRSGCAAFAAVVVVGAASRAPAQTVALADLHGLGPRQVKTEAFILPAAQDVQIEAVGAESVSKSSTLSRLTAMWQREAATAPWSGNAWILDLSTRKVAWELSAAQTTSGTAGAREFKGGVKLPAGTYAAYYASFPDGEYWTDEGGKTRAARKWHWFGDEPVDQFKLIVRGSGQRIAGAALDRATAASSSAAVIALRGTTGEQFQQAGFALAKPTEVEIYAEGEARQDGEFDYGWIINADTRAPVWTLSWRDSEPAGGADKNRVARTSRLLPAGRYAAFYATDDSHDPSEWNAPPPHDPDGWGLRVGVKNTADRAAITTFAYEHVPANATIVALTGLGDSQSRTKGFTLTRPMDVRVYALGEGRSGRMNDYGWITSGSSRTRVWEMRFDDTEPAGGDRKNRLVDTVLHLPTGSYVVHYLSDDSHSAGAWNAAAPADGRRWGITVLAVKGPLDRSVVAEYHPEADPTILAQLTGVRDDAQVRKPFTLERAGAVRIYALGEGTGNEMADYGWIEDAKTGHRVWEMTYRATQHAGGATKNRKFDGAVPLPAGEYVLRYETDGSHAFGDWNAAAPDDPEAWGITVYRPSR